MCVIKTTKTYLGDGVYASFDDAGQIVLTVENGVEATAHIYLEPAVLEALLRYARAHGYRPSFASEI